MTAEREFEFNKKVQFGEIELKQIDNETKIQAATRIQAFWRGCIVRRNLKGRQCRFEELMNMVVPSWLSGNKVFDKEEETLMRKLEIQPLEAKKLEERMASEREKVN